jgi:hypothetical protein
MKIYEFLLYCEENRDNNARLVLYALWYYIITAYTGQGPIN